LQRTAFGSRWTQALYASPLHEAFSNCLDPQCSLKLHVEDMATKPV